MAYLMVDAPSKQIAGAPCAKRSSRNHSGAGTVSNADMISAGVHKRLAEHPHITDVVAGAGYLQVIFINAMGVVH